MKIGIHITHEAVHKIGGIGSVIDGLCTADNYKSYFEKTLLYSPLFSYSGDVFSRLGKGGEVLYSNHDSYDAGRYHDLFMELISKYHIDIVYGRRTLVNEFNINKINSVDALLVGVSSMRMDQVDLFKHRLWEKYGIESDRYSDWDYEQYLRIAVPYMEVLGILYPGRKRCIHFSHEYMGIVSALAVSFESPGNVDHRTVFYAHEVSPCREVVENHPGHDISFYNLMKVNRERGKFFEDEYGSKKSSYRAELVKRSTEFDYVFAVSDIIKDEYLYFVPSAEKKTIKVVYNGIPLRYITHEEKLRSRKLLQEYINNLFNYTPDIIFTHVTRLVMSKGIWRDITFLYILDELFHKSGLKGAFILLSTLIGTGREPSTVSSMEKEYGWPVSHREGWPDLVGTEKDIYNFLSLFNARSRSIKGLFLNQFGFDKRKCGERVPEETRFSDLRIGSDAELGFSIYEPFGIAQLETLPFGGIAALSSSCGCSCFIEKKLKDFSGKLYSIFDFVSGSAHISNISQISTEQRFQLERELFKRTANNFFEMLPMTDENRLALLDSIQDRLETLGWESITASIDFPGL